MTTMSECYKKDEGKSNVTLKFKRGELLYDIQNYAYVEGDVSTNVNEHARHQIMDIGQDGNIDRATRVLNAAHAECVEMLYPYTKEDIPESQSEMNDELRELEEYDIRLSLPAGFSLTTLNMLTDFIHEYLVCRVLADWMSIVNPTSSAKWEMKYASLRDKIKASLLSRTGKVRRKLKPF